MLPHFSTFADVLNWLVGPGALIVSGFFASYVLERISLWHKINHDLKAVLVVALAVGVSYGASYVLTRPIIAYNPVLDQIVALFVFYAATQFAYKRYFEVGGAAGAPAPVKK